MVGFGAVGFCPPGDNGDRRGLGAAVVVVEAILTKVTIEGHPSNEGDPEYDKGRSQRRAEAVVKYLIEKGVDATKLEAIGDGMERPITFAPSRIHTLTAAAFTRRDGLVVRAKQELRRGSCA